MKSSFNVAGDKETISKTAAAADSIYRIQTTKRICLLSGLLLIFIEGLHFVALGNYAVLLFLLGEIGLFFQFASAEKQINELKEKYNI